MSSQGQSASRGACGGRGTEADFRLLGVRCAREYFKYNHRRKFPQNKKTDNFLTSGGENKTEPTQS